MSMKWSAGYLESRPVESDGALYRLELAIEVFVRGHCADKSRTFPYEATRVGPLGTMLMFAPAR